MPTTRVAVDAPTDLPDATDEAPFAPWHELLERWIGDAIVIACVVLVFVELHPKLLLTNTTADGGDMGAHVWLPAYLRDHLLPWRLAGWSPDWYAGFPAGQFYFPLPAVAIAVFDIFLPYNVAFKLVTVAGSVALPAAAYAFGRGIRAPKPAPAFFALAATAFLFFKGGGQPGSIMQFDLHIMGGNLPSTMAGEYSFVLALAFALFFLGAFARAIDKRGSYSVAAILFAATLTSHLVVGVFAGYAAVVLLVVRVAWRAAPRALVVLGVGGLLTAVWLVPLAARLGYTTDMRYEPVASGANVPNYFDWMFPGTSGGIAHRIGGVLWYLYPLAAVALVAGAVYLRRATRDLAALALAAALLFYNWEGIRSVFGRAPAWNLRLLPFWFVMVYLLAGFGAAEVVRGVAWVASHLDQLRNPDSPATSAAGGTAALVEPGDEGGGSVGDGLGDGTGSRAPVPAGPGPDDRPDDDDEDLAQRRDPRDRWRAFAAGGLAMILAVVALVRVNDTKGFIKDWAQYNYTGYEGRGAPPTYTAYQEYRAFIDTVDKLAPGRLLWEGGNAIGAYGTPLALMILPYWTHGRIASMEGLYFEASATTPYHFMAVATLAKTPSNPVRGIPYRTITDFDLGVHYLQLMGVRYYAAFTPEAKTHADASPILVPIATVPDLDGQPPNGWTIYRVKDSPLVEPLAYQPVVIDDAHADDNWRCDGEPKPAPDQQVPELSAWECTAVPWWNDPGALGRPLAADGPASWQRADQAVARTAARRALPAITVSHVKSGDHTVDFDVSRTGVPVMVKVSYYPSWRAEGADGPWRATPNFMVVVPTAKHVHLVFSDTGIDWLGRIGTLAGLGALGGLVLWDLGLIDVTTGEVWWRPRMRFRRRRRA
jgi:hypothetical protein